MKSQQFRLVSALLAFCIMPIYSLLWKSQLFITAHRMTSAHSGTTGHYQSSTYHQSDASNDDSRKSSVQLTLLANSASISA